ncbi:hypothetical protein RBB79_02575 [Tunturiibacter empetritectus]|uniref:DNA-binding response OmpR family regulator n=1 Tax=Tunturiibacter lichenicola TaxID=2051959 RepID=A0A852VC19_9BACT|nr:hypothetical protein [Edaphobacter lichenicola]NYF88389.1 DNA-binding response OmpR family regulator [Edaphobacter lichenicola]
MRVLLVEDEIRLTEDVGHALREGTGFTVDHAEDGRMGLDGLTVLRRLRERGNSTGGESA